MLKGEAVYLYAFDVANEIVTEKIQQILSARPFPFEIRTDHTVPKDVPLYRPLAIEPPPRVAANGRPVRLLIRVYDVGVVSVMMRVSFEVSELAELLPLHHPVDDQGKTFDQVARQLCADACDSLREAMSRGSPPSEPEAYTVFCLTEFTPPSGLPSWLDGNRRAIAELLAESAPDSLSETTIAEVLRLQTQYTANDLVIVDWDAAFVVDVDRYVDDVLYVIELANLQLEEYRVMDERIDRHLTRAYDNLLQHRPGLWTGLSKILRSLRLFAVDVAKLNDEVTHISKFFGDWYLARVYAAAQERFHLPRWRDSVERRLQHVDNLYNVVNADLNTARMFWLELIIVVFFAIDLAAILFFKK